MCYLSWEILCNKIVSSTIHVVSSFFKKSDTGHDQNTFDLNQAIENVERKGERDRTRRIFEEYVNLVRFESGHPHLF